MHKLPRVTLLKQVKIGDRWRHARALFDSKGRVRRDRVRVDGKDESHSEGSYFIEWWDHGKRHCEPAGANAQDAADKARVKQAQLTAERNGIIPALPQPRWATTQFDLLGRTAMLPRPGTTRAKSAPS